MRRQTPFPTLLVSRPVTPAEFLRPASTKKPRARGANEAPGFPVRLIFLLGPGLITRVIPVQKHANRNNCPSRSRFNESSVLPVGPQPQINS
jgi:hypothetical protein